MKTIPLTQGKVALVDDADYEWLNQWRWCALKPNRTWYALRRRRKSDGPGPGAIWMHREILGTSDDMWGHHINGNGLDNRRANLRSITPSLNARNRVRKPFRRGSRRVLPMGVYPRGRRFEAAIGNEGKMKYIGRFDTPEEAQKAYAAERAKIVAKAQAVVAAMVEGGAT